MSSVLAWNTFADNNTGLVARIKKDSTTKQDQLFLIYDFLYVTVETKHIVEELVILSIPYEKAVRFKELHETKPSKETISILVCLDTKCQFFQVKF